MKTYRAKIFTHSYNRYFLNYVFLDNKKIVSILDIRISNETLNYIKNGVDIENFFNNLEIRDKQLQLVSESGTWKKGAWRY